MDDAGKYDTHLAFRTAEMLALPQLVCRYRLCGRLNRCDLFFRTTGEPCCISNLRPDQRRIYEELYALALKVRRQCGSPLVIFDSRDPMKRELEEAAIEIVSHTLSHPSSRAFRKRFHAWRRARAKYLAAPAPPGWKDDRGFPSLVDPDAPRPWWVWG